MRKPVVLSRGKSGLRSVLKIFVSQSTEKTSSIGVSFFFIFQKFKFVSVILDSLKEILFWKNSYSVLGTQSNLGFCSLFGLSIPVRVLKPVDFSGGKSVLRSVLNIFVSQSTEKTSSIGVSFFLNFLKFKFVSVIWESLKEILPSEK